MDKYDELFSPSFLNNSNQNILPLLPKEPTVTMAYIPFQQQAVIYSEEDAALDAGTLFPELNKPFTGKGVLK